MLQKIKARQISTLLETSGLLLDTLRIYHPYRDTPSSHQYWHMTYYEGFLRKEETTIVTLDLEDADNGVDYTTLLTLMMEGDDDTCLI